MSKLTTKPLTPKLSEIAREVIAPTGIVSTGWPAVEDKCRDLGISFRPWQPSVGRLILAKRADGKYAATVGGIGISIPRQVGKTFLVGAIVFALCLLRPNLTVVWTSHRLRTAEETFGKMLVFAKRRQIAPHILKTRTGSGEGSVIFRNGSRILFGARERGFGRGFDAVDVLVFDEAQILTDSALDDMVPAANQSRQDTSALQLFMGTPPKPKDPAEVFTRMRTEALSGEDDDTGWVEFGADQGFHPTLLPSALKKADWTQVAKANPSYPHDTPREAILRMRKKLGPDSFLREGLGIWDEANARTAFGVGKWEACSADPVAGLTMGAFGIAVTRDLTHSAIVGAGFDDDGCTVVKPIQHGPGTGWVVEAAKQLSDKHKVAGVIDSGGPGALLVPLLEAAGIELRVTKTSDVLDACGGIHELIRGERLRHADYAELNSAVDGAVQRDVRDRWVWDRRKSTTDISPLEAATLATWGLQSAPLRESAYADHDLIVI